MSSAWGRCRSPAATRSASCCGPESRVARPWGSARRRYNRAPFLASAGVSMGFALVFPGQGSQSVGMLAALYAAEEGAHTAFAEASRVLGYDLWQLVSSGPESELNATERTQ